MDDFPPPRSVNKLKNLQNLLSLSAAALIITVWSTVSFLVYQNKLMRNYSKQYLITKKIAPNTNQLKDWETYSSDRLHFGISYPPDLECGLAGDDYGPNGYMECYRNKVNLFTIHLQPEYSPEIVGHFMGMEPLGKQEISKEAWNYYNFDIEDSLTKTKYHIFAYEIVKNNILYIIVFRDYPNLTTEQDQILSTFKFSDQTADASAWETYRNAEYGFEFKHPKDWIIENIDVPFSENDFSFYLKPQIKSTNKSEVLTIQIMKNVTASYYFDGCCKNKSTTPKGTNKYYTVGNPSILEGMVEWIYVTGDKDKLAVFSFGVGVRGDPTPVTSPYEVQKELSTFDQILSTFKFLN